MDKFLKLAVWPIIIAPLVYLALSWSGLPDSVALHFNIDGTPDRFGSKTELLTAVLLLSGVNLVTYLLVSNAYRIDPKKYAIENKTRLARISFVIAVFISGIVAMLIYGSESGRMKFNPSLVFAAVGILFAFIGNYMYSIKPNYFAGIRLPWTLENEENWRKTHQLAGKLWFAGGLAIALFCILTPKIISMVIFFTITILITVVPAIYSYRLYKQTKTN